MTPPAIEIRDCLLEQGITYQHVAIKLGLDSGYTCQILSGSKPLTNRFIELLCMYYSFNPKQIKNRQELFLRKEKGIKPKKRKKYKSRIPTIPREEMSELKSLTKYLKREVQVDYPGRLRSQEFIKSEKRLIEIVSGMVK